MHLNRQMSTERDGDTEKLSKILFSRRLLMMARMISATNNENMSKFVNIMYKIYYFYVFVFRRGA